MSDLRITDMPSKYPANGDFVPVVSDNKNFKVTVGDLKESVTSEAEAAVLLAQLSALQSQNARDIAVATNSTYATLALAQAGSVNGDFFTYTDASGNLVYATKSGGIVSVLPGPWISDDKIGRPLFSDISSMVTGCTVFFTSGYSQAGVGMARYIYDAAVNPAFCDAHPRAAKMSANGRGYRLDIEQGINVCQFGAIGTQSPSTVNDCNAAFTAAQAYSTWAVSGAIGGSASGTVLIPAGHFGLNEWMWNAHTSFVGHSMEATCLVYRKEAAGGVGSFLIGIPSFNVGSAVPFAGFSEMRLQGFANSSATDGLCHDIIKNFGYGIDRQFRLFRMTFTYCSGDGANLYETNTGIINCNISDLRFDGVGGYGIRIGQNTYGSGHPFNLDYFTMDNEIDHLPHLISKITAAGFYSNGQWGRGLARVIDGRGLTVTITNSRIELGKALIPEVVGANPPVAGIVQYSDSTGSRGRIILGRISGNVSSDANAAVAFVVDHNANLDFECEPSVAITGVACMYRDMLTPSKNVRSIGMHTKVRPTGIAMGIGDVLEGRVFNHTRQSVPDGDNIAFEYFGRAGSRVTAERWNGAGRPAEWVQVSPSDGIGKALTAGAGVELTTTGVCTAGSTSISLPSASSRANCCVDLAITLIGAGVAAADLNTKITGIDATTGAITVANAPSTSVNPLTIRYQQAQFMPVSYMPGFGVPSSIDNTFTLGLSAPLQFFNNPLSANRTQTLAVNTGVTGKSTAVTGKFRFVRGAGATGAFSIDINGGAGVIASLTAINQWVEVELYGTTWFVTASGVLSNPSAGDRTFFIDPSTGNDSNVGTYSAPLATFARAVTLGLGEGDTVVVKGRDPVVRESIVVPAGVTVRPEQGQWLVMGFDAVPDTWAANPVEDAVTYTGLYKVTVPNLLVGAANKCYPMMFRKDTGVNLVEIKNTGVAGTYTDTTKALCLAKVLATPNSFYMECSNGSKYTTGFTAGGTISYFINLNGSVPSTNMLQATRSRPVFGNGCRVYDMTCVGGIDHNGIELQFCYGERISNYYFGAHGMFCAGATLVDPLVRFGRVDSGTTYFYHAFNGSTTYTAMCRLVRPVAKDGPSNFALAFGQHSEVGSPLCSDSFVIEDAVVERVNTLCGFGGTLAKGATFRNLKAAQIQQIGGGNDNAVFEDGEIGFAPFTGSQGVMGIGCPATGKVHEYRNCKIASVNGTLLRVTGASAGRTDFYNTALVVHGESVNSRWAQIGAACNFNFYNSAIQGVGLDGSFYNISENAGQAFLFNNTPISGIAPPTSGTVTYVNRSVGGDLGLSIDRQGLPLLAHNNALTWSGYQIKDMWGISRRSLTLYSGILMAVSSLIDMHVLPPGTWNRVSSVQNGSHYMVIVGDAGKLAYKTYDASVATAWTVVDTTGFTSINFVSVIGGRSDGKIWLGGHDGSITEYVIGGALTARTSGVAYPLTFGVVVGTKVIMGGGNANGQTAGTAGGVVVSDDSGVTWAASLTFGDSTPANIGNYAYEMKVAGYVNGVYFLAGCEGQFLTSTTGAAASWTARNRVIGHQFQHVAVDTVRKAILLGGPPLRGENCAGGLLTLINASDVSPANWTTQAVQAPVNHIGGVAWQADFLIGGVANTSGPAYSVAGKYGQIFRSPDATGGWDTISPRMDLWPQPSDNLFPLEVQGMITNA